MPTHLRTPVLAQGASEEALATGDAWDEAIDGGCEALVLPLDTPRGIVTITYKGQPLGSAKNIGNRANNLYPKAWRIKSTHLPTEAPKVLI